MRVVGLCVATLLVCCFMAPSYSEAQTYGGYGYRPQPRDAVEDFLSRNTIYIRPAIGDGFAGYQNVFDAVGNLRIDVLCPANADSIGGWRERGARVYLERADGAARNPAVLSTVIGAAQVQARNECHSGVVDAYEMGFVEIYGPARGDSARLLWSARIYALGNWGEFHDVLAEEETAARAAEAARIQAQQQAEAAAERQRQFRARREQQERDASSAMGGFVFIVIVVSGIWIVWKWIQAADRDRKREDAERAAREAREERERRDRKERKEQEERERVARQEAIRRELQTLHSSSIDAFGRVPKALMSAEMLLDTAEKDFEENAFSPFWDDIEHAINKIGEASESVDSIKRSANRYKELAAKSESRAQAFPVEVEEAQRLVVANETGQRLKAIVRVAQRNFQFASIYEQRKTNQILIAGFANLGDAITGLGDHLSYAISEVGSSIEGVNRSIRDMEDGQRERARENQRMQRELHEQLSEQLAEQHSSGQRANAQRDEVHAEKMKSALEMLDNLQRGRKPSW